MNRQEVFSFLSDNPEISVLIIGGGINGVGTFRDLALQGVDVLLIDRLDFCSGASAASSHMAHGGIRYLENGEFRLVREAVQERNSLIENAPHLVRPLPTTIPIFRWFLGLFNAPLKFLRLLNKPVERGAIVIKLGLILYDSFTHKQHTVPRHHFRFHNESLHCWNHLNQKVICTATYYDGSILSPERLTIELLLDAEGEGNHARAINYAELVGIKDDIVTLQDALTGETFNVKPRLVVNAAGPWIDLANQALGLSTHFIGGTKGSHLVLNNPELRAAIGNHEFFFENKDGRIVLIFPLYDKVLVGTSDIPIENPDDARCTDSETGYFLEMVNRVFPDIMVDHSQIVFRFSGVRPLPASSAKTTGQISRDHSIQVINGARSGMNFPVYSLVGGKWTSFRAFSEMVTNKVLKYFNLNRQKDTRSIPIGGGRNYPPTSRERSRWLDGLHVKNNLSLERLDVLFERYGTRVEDISIFMSQGIDKPLKTLPDYSQREIGFLAQNEKIVHLDDLLLRRSLLAMLGRLTCESVDELADALGDALGWDKVKKKDELKRSLEIMSDRHGVVFDQFK